MIELHISPARVERVLFVCDSDIAEDFDLAAYQAIRPFIAQIDATLREIVASLRLEDKAERGENKSETNGER